VKASHNAVKLQQTRRLDERHDDDRPMLSGSLAGDDEDAAADHRANAQSVTGPSVRLSTGLRWHRCRKVGLLGE
jgi:hypothetical protein